MQSNDYRPLLKKLTMEHSTRHPAVSGSFYPSDPQKLRNLVNGFLRNAPAEHAENANTRAIIVPHAGYRFSGSTAATAYSILRNRSCKTVFLIGNAHYCPFEGIALDSNLLWESPLGRVRVNRSLAEELQGKHPELFFFSEPAHRPDHILEVQLPFIQCVLKRGFTILPMLFGKNPSDIYLTATTFLLDVLQPDDILIVSTDLSHYPSAHDASSIDRKTLDCIVKKDIPGLERHVRATMELNVPHEETLFCGPDAIKTLMRLALLEGWTAKPLRYANSGDGPFADKKAVVGYAAAAFNASSDDTPSLHDPVKTFSLSPDIS